MSRSGYSDDCDGWDLIRWRGAVNAATKGKRGQALLREMLVALDAMPDKRLISDELERDGEYCALGVVGKARGLVMEGVDPEDRRKVASMFDIAPALAAEIVYMNDDEDWWEPTRTTPEQRWGRMRAWVASQIKEQ